MSELKDLAAALGAMSKSLTSIEEHCARQAANGEQLRLGLHSMRSVLTAKGLEDEERERALKQVQEWMGDFSHKLGELHEMTGALQGSLADHRREVNDRIRHIEPPEEVTQP